MFRLFLPLVATIKRFSRPYYDRFFGVPAKESFDNQILEDLIMKRNQILGYNPILYSPMNFTLKFIEEKKYRHFLHKCIKHLHYNIRPILEQIHHVGDINHIDSTNSWMYYAINYENYTAMRILIELGIKINHDDFMSAVSRNDLIAVEILLQSGADPNYYNMHYDQPLFEIASNDEFIDMARLLFNYGADINGHHLSIPLWKAEESKQPKMKNFLIESGCITNFDNYSDFVAYQIPPK